MADSTKVQIWVAAFAVAGSGLAWLSGGSVLGGLALGVLAGALLCPGAWVRKEGNRG